MAREKEKLEGEIKPGENNSNNDNNYNTSSTNAAGNGSVPGANANNENNHTDGEKDVGQEARINRNPSPTLSPRANTSIPAEVFSKARIVKSPIPDRVGGETGVQSGSRFQPLSRSHAVATEENAADLFSIGGNIIIYLFLLIVDGLIIALRSSSVVDELSLSLSPLSLLFSLHS